MGDFTVIDHDNFITAVGVAVIDEHERDGTVFDEHKLKIICDNCNKRIADTGDEVPLVPGHVNSPEETNEILGWAKNFRIGNWGKIDPRKAILADLTFTKEKWEKAKDLPRRSIELWDWKTEDAYIDPIALISRSTPYRDLGLLYKKSNEHNKYIYSMGENEMTQEELAIFVNECILKYEKDKMEDKEIDKIECAKDEQIEESEESLKNQRDQANRKYARLEHENKLMSDRIAQLEKQERISSRKADLLSVEAEGVLFDMSEELETVSDMEPAVYEKHLNVMRKRYSRAPIGINIPVAPMPAQGIGQKLEFSQEDVRKAADLIFSGKARNSEEAFTLIRSNI